MVVPVRTLYVRKVEVKEYPPAAAKSSAPGSTSKIITEQSSNLKGNREPVLLANAKK